MEQTLLEGEPTPNFDDSRLETVIPGEYVYEPFYHDLYNDIFYKDVVFQNKRNGYFVEVGALDGLLMSQSFLFERTLGWNGIVVEPNPTWKSNLDLHRGCNISTEAISDTTGKATFECREIPSFSGLKSSVNEARISDIIDEIEVDTITLCSLLDKFKAPEVIDWVSIDTEGCELDIIKQYFKENTKYKINLINFESNEIYYAPLLFETQPYLKIRNPYLDFLKISGQGLLKFDPYTGELFKSPFKEWKYEGSPFSSDIRDVTFEHYYIHMDYLKENLHLKPLLININTLE
jgi:FkbM family methyltransferase